MDVTQGQRVLIKKSEQSESLNIDGLQGFIVKDKDAHETDLVPKRGHHIIAIGGTVICKYYHVPATDVVELNNV